jgi:hypothetical protein
MENKLMPAIFLLAICLGTILVIFAGLKRLSQRSFLTRFIVIVLAWLVVTGALAGAGFFQFFSLPPRVPLVVLIPVVTVLIFAYTKKCREFLHTVPPHWLVMIQSFRVVVEVWLWYAFEKRLIPEQMTFEGRNFDILSGILGLVAGWVVMSRGRGWQTITVIYNLIGLGLLLNIVIVAVLSFPGPTRYFMNEPANVIVAEFPFIYLPGVLVVIAFIFHILSLRQVAVVAK